MDTKQCRRCSLKKRRKKFYKHPMMLDGHLNICIECTKKRVHEHRQKNIDQIRKYDRYRGGLPHRVLARNIYAKTKEGKIAFKKYRIKWLQNNSNKRAAHIILGNAVRAGKIQRLPCEVCKSTKRIHGHHNDYTKPLEVRWLCPKHHSEIHKEDT